jgi:hypothetical protein
MKTLILKLCRILEKRDDETAGDYCIRVANDGYIITIWFALGSVLLIGGLIMAGCM